MTKRVLVTDRARNVVRGCQCDCGNHSCGADLAPVFLLVERDGKEMRVCSRCDLTSDKKLARLVTKVMPIQPFVDFDILGAMCIPKYFDLPVEAAYRKANTRKARKSA
jgi:hypothetical protein